MVRVGEKYFDSKKPTRSKGKTKKSPHGRIQHSPYSLSKYLGNLFPGLLEGSLEATNFTLSQQ